MGCRRTVAVVFAALLALLISAPALAAGTHAPVSVRLKFRLVARGVSSPLVTGRYVTFTETSSTRRRTVERFVLLDDQTGKRIATPQGCYGAVLAATWVVCQPSGARPYQVYNIHERKLRRLPCIGLCESDYYLQDIVGVGSRWFEVRVEPHESCGDGVHYTCGPTTLTYYSVHTGKPKVPLVSDAEAVDLNSPTLSRRLCSPLREPAGYSPTTATGPTLTFDGIFAIAQEASGIYIEQCGSHLHRLLVGTPTTGGSVLANAHAIAFCAAGTEGFLLPSLTPFTIVAPGCPQLGSRHAYEIGLGNQLWAAPLPRSMRDSVGH
jgi:hypothetical protein